MTNQNTYAFCTIGFGIFLFCVILFAEYVGDKPLLKTDAYIPPYSPNIKKDLNTIRNIFIGVASLITLAGVFVLIS